VSILETEYLHFINHRYTGTAQGRGWELTIFYSKPLLLPLKTQGLFLLLASGKFHLHVMDKGSGFLRSKVQKLTRLQRYNTLTLSTLLYGSKTWTPEDQQKSRITAQEIKFLRKTAKYTLFSRKRNDSICKERKIQPVLEQINNCNSKWIQHVHQMARSRLMQAIMKYQLAGKRNPGHPLKRLNGF